MNKYQQKEEMRKALLEQFGELNGQQLWTLVKLAKYVRLRCRNNSAFNNSMNEFFPYAQFRQVNKTRRDGTVYPGLQITVKGEIAQSNMEENDEE